MHIGCLCHLPVLRFPPESAKEFVTIWLILRQSKISAGVSTGIGSHVEDIEDKGDDQFEISDGRSVDEVYQALLNHDLQPVMNDYVYL